MSNDNLVHPYYNNGYARYDLSIEDIIAGLKKAGYNLDGNSPGTGGNTGGTGDKEENDNTYKLQIFFTNGNEKTNENFSTTMYVRLFINNEDVTDSTPPELFKWTRISGNDEVAQAEDAEWNLRFASGCKEILVLASDVLRNCFFTCQYVEYRNEEEYVQQAYSKYLELNKE